VVDKTLVTAVSPRSVLAGLRWIRHIDRELIYLLNN
jgi:hypothetical protein